MTDVIDIKVDDREVERLFKKIAHKAEHPEPFLKVVGMIGVTSIQKNFEVGGRYSRVGSWEGGSTKWEPLSVATLFSGKRSKYVGKRGRYRKGVEERLKNRSILVKTSKMMGSVTYAVGGGSVELGVKKDQAALQNFGGKAGVGKNVEVPGRPFMVIQAEDIADIIAEGERFLTKGTS